MFSKIYVLGACARRGYLPDVLQEGTSLNIHVKDSSTVCVYAEERFIGLFPPDVAQSYLALLDDNRFMSVVVIRTVDLNDKYGQLYVRQA
jgi:hypothetical protein